MPDALLVVNAGSSSLKFSVFRDEGPPRLLLHGAIEEVATRPRFTARDPSGVVAEKKWADGTRLGHEGAIGFLLSEAAGGVLSGHRVAAAGHRVVHGGADFAGPRVVDAETLRRLEELVPLAPLHQPHNLAAIPAVSERAPALPQVACSDTPLHRSQPAVAQAFALPRRYAEEGIRRYGFHGLSYEFIASRMPAVDPRAASGRTVAAHLGNGASLCAMAGGRSVATTM